MIMNEHLKFHPQGLTDAQFQQLSDASERASGLTHLDLLVEVEQHLIEAKAARDNNSMVNLPLAEAMADAFRQVAEIWDSLPVNSLSWLKGAMQYFRDSDDDEPDFSSPIGFEDDLEIMNACLCFAELDHLCLKPEGFDSV